MNSATIEDIIDREDLFRATEHLVDARTVVSVLLERENSDTVESALLLINRTIGAAKSLVEKIDRQVTDFESREMQAFTAAAKPADAAGEPDLETAAQQLRDQEIRELRISPRENQLWQLRRRLEAIGWRLYLFDAASVEAIALPAGGPSQWHSAPAFFGPEIPRDPDTNRRTLDRLEAFIGELEADRSVGIDPQPRLRAAEIARRCRVIGWTLLNGQNLGEFVLHNSAGLCACFSRNQTSDAELRYDEVENAVLARVEAHLAYLEDEERARQADIGRGG